MQAQVTAKAPTRTLLTAFVVIVASFFGATVYTQRASQRIDAAVETIVDNTSPSIEHLAAARGEIHHVQHLVGEYIRARESGQPVTLEALNASREILGTEIRKYLALPVSDRERDGAIRLGSMWGRFDALVDATVNQADAGAYAAARAMERADVRPTSGQLIGVAMELVDLNARDGRELASQALTWRHQTDSIAILLDILCVLVAAASVHAVFRAQRRHTELLVTHADVVRHRADELESFAGRVAHDILSPLSAVKMALALTARKARGNTDIEPQIERAERSLTRTASVVDGLLAFARAGAPPDGSAVVSVAPVLLGVLDEARAAADASTIELSMEPFVDVSVLCAEGVLVSLSSNLVRNAIKYMGDGAERRITVRVIMRGELVRIEVADTGPGLAPQLEGRVFEPYVRAPGLKQVGMGLGLATVKRLAEGHGGAVGVRSVPDRGCVFWFDLPSASETLQAGSNRRGEITGVRKLDAG